jgi:DNA polymerase-3 subunit gamma/tau
VCAGPRGPSRSTKDPDGRGVDARRTTFSSPPGPEEREDAGVSRSGKNRPAAGARPHVAFARKYRPLSFTGVVGQEAVGRTLRGALRSGEIPSSFLFAGPRGVGKTTMARILAKAMNCAAADAPTPDPCGECATCEAIADGSSLDVVEVDAASHNGVDDVREIRERVAHLPASGRCKVYILDEAHMFSTAAWNAFLKTLEEPPPHARFVFATTEPEKVPETILSRCQRFDFRRISSADIVATLRSIVERENSERGKERAISVDDAALAAIARFARGGLRDAESLLEQAVLAGEGKVREEDLAALLGSVPRELVRAALERAAAGDAAGTLEACGRVHDSGGDGAAFLGQALEMLREATAVAVAGPKTSLVEGDDDERASLAALGKAFGPAGTLRATQALAEALRLVKATDEERPLVDAGMLRVALQGRAKTVPEVLADLAAMEARLSGEGGGAAPPRPSEAAAPAGGTAARRSLFGNDRPPLPGPATADAGTVLTLDLVRREWPRVLEEARTTRSLAISLAAATPAAVDEGGVTLSFPPSMAFHRSVCEDDEKRRTLAAVLARVFGRTLAPRFAAGEEPKPEEGREAAPAAEEFDRLRAGEIEDLKQAPSVKALEKELGVRMVRVGRRRTEDAESTEGTA